MTFAMLDPAIFAMLKADAGRGISTDPNDYFAQGAPRRDRRGAGNGHARVESTTADEAHALIPNREDISAHLYTLFAPEFVQPYPDSWIEIAYANPASDKMEEFPHFSPFDLDKVIAFAEAKNKAGFNIYVGATLRHGETPAKSRGRASRANALMGHLSWADFDKEGDDVKVDATLKEENLVPAMTLATGRTPYPRGHVYLKLASGVTADEVEKANIALKTLFGSDAVQDPARLMRRAGTINYPTPKKVERGYVTELVTLHIRKDAPSYTVEYLMSLAGTTEAGGAKADASTDSPLIDWSKAAEHAGWLKTAADLPIYFNAKGRIIVAHEGNLKDLNIDLKQAGLVEKPYGSWSDVSFALAAIFKADGRFAWEQIAAALLCNLDCNQHVTKQSDEGKRRRAVERLLTRSFETTHNRVARALNWRECHANGAPKPSMHNARLAITALGIEGSYDTFHNKMLFGYKNEETRHVVESALGNEVNDNGIIALRQLLSDRFGFDLTDKHVRDAVISLALERCFDPIANMLDEAERDWDGVARLDRMAADYFNCEDTPLNAACVRRGVSQR
jgi:hypothetical protein